VFYKKIFKAVFSQKKTPEKSGEVKTNLPGVRRTFRISGLPVPGSSPQGPQALLPIGLLLSAFRGLSLQQRGAGPPISQRIPGPTANRSSNRPGGRGFLFPAQYPCPTNPVPQSPRHLLQGAPGRLRGTGKRALRCVPVYGPTA